VHVVELNAVLRRAVEQGASDVHLKVGQLPVARRDGTLTPFADHPPLTDADLEAALAIVSELTPAKREAFYETGELDIAYTSGDLPRFRVNAFRQRGSISFAFRVIPKHVPSFEDLRMPPGVKAMADEHRGLVLVTGATGSGKTTTLAAIIDHINRSRRQHIVTIEDPIEILHADKCSIVNQREVGTDTADFHAALKRVLRQDPDVILVGEVRDVETVKTALTAAETGHLVFSTLHTISATDSINRIIDFFAPHEQRQVRMSLAGSLRGIVSQRLVEKRTGGRAPAVEVLVSTGRIFDKIVNPDETHEIESIIAEGEYYGMQTFDQSLFNLYKNGLVSLRDAMSVASHPHDFRIALQQAGLSVS